MAQDGLEQFRLDVFEHVGADDQIREAWQRRQRGNGGIVVAHVHGTRHQRSQRFAERPLPAAVIEHRPGIEALHEFRHGWRPLPTLAAVALRPRVEFRLHLAVAARDEFGRRERHHAAAFCRRYQRRDASAIIRRQARQRRYDSVGCPQLIHACAARQRSASAFFRCRSAMRSCSVRPPDRRRSRQTRHRVYPLMRSCLLTSSAHSMHKPFAFRRMRSSVDVMRSPGSASM
jgi:hypothetical protein